MQHESIATEYFNINIILHISGALYMYINEVWSVYLCPKVIPWPGHGDEGTLEQLKVSGMCVSTESSASDCLLLLFCLASACLSPSKPCVSLMDIKCQHVLTYLYVLMLFLQALSSALFYIWKYRMNSSHLLLPISQNLVWWIRLLKKNKDVCT